MSFLYANTVYLISVLYCYFNPSKLLFMYENFLSIGMHHHDCFYFYFQMIFVNKILN